MRNIDKIENIMEDQSSMNTFVSLSNTNLQQLNQNKQSKWRITDFQESKSMRYVSLILINLIYFARVKKPEFSIANSSS
jgi:hypothetical protein